MHNAQSNIRITNHTVQSAISGAAKLAESLGNLLGDAETARLLSGPKQHAIAREINALKEVLAAISAPPAPQPIPLTDGVELAGGFAGIQINAPAYFDDPGFLKWLNDPQTNVMTWHKKGSAINDYSDVVVMVDPSLCGEGTDSDMPEAIWDAVVTYTRKFVGEGQTRHIPVWITNLGM